MARKSRRATTPSMQKHRGSRFAKTHKGGGSGPTKQSGHIDSIMGSEYGSRRGVR